MTRHSVHDLIHVSVEGRGADAEGFRRWLRELPGIGQTVIPPDITWRPGPSRGPAPHVRVTEAGRWECSGSGHEPLLVLQHHLLDCDASLVHACALEFCGRGVVVCGSSRTGKTVVALSALTDPRVRLLSDDLCILRADGRVLSMPAPLAVYPLHLALIPAARRAQLRSFERVRRVLRALLTLPSLRPLARRLRDRWAGGQGAGYARVRLVHTDYLLIPPRRLFHPQELVEAAQAGLVVVLDPDATPWQVEVLSREHARSLLLFITYQNGEMASAAGMYARMGALDQSRHYARAQGVIERALSSGVRALRVGVPRQAEPERLQAFLLDLIEKA